MDTNQIWYHNADMIKSSIGVALSCLLVGAAATEAPGYIGPESWDTMVSTSMGGALMFLAGIAKSAVNEYKKSVKRREELDNLRIQTMHAQSADIKESQAHRALERQHWVRVEQALQGPRHLVPNSSVGLSSLDSRS